MASNFDYQRKFSISEATWNAGVLLFNSQYYRQATILFWQSIRYKLFGWLEMKARVFNSTRDALMIAVSTDDLSDQSSKIIFLYMIGTMAEWDETFHIDLDEASDYKNICLSVIEALK